MKRYRITLEGRTYDVRLLDDPRQDRVRVQVDGEILTVDVETPASPAQGRPGGPDAAPAPAAEPALGAARGPHPSAPSDGLVTAPLPGLIKTVEVRPGQEVAPGDRLLVIEAMKMDNVIRAPRRGTIDTLHVAEGQHVAHGDPLLALAK
jgi:biotin carboxyl carrier protein